MSGRLGELARAAVTVDRSRVAPGVGLRTAAGVAVTLIVGRATGHTVAGVTATIGALSAGMASHQGTYRTRAGVVAAAAGAMGLTSFVGSSVGHVAGADVALTAVFAFAAAMLVSLGPSGTVIGIQAVVGFVVFSQFDLPLPVAARTGGLVVLGGAVQAALVVLPWPLRRFPVERRAVAGALGTLATYCRDLARAAPGETPPLVAPEALQALAPIMYDPQPFGGPEAAAFQTLASQVERIHLEVTALARLRWRASSWSPDQHGTGAGPLAEVLDVTADVLADLARSVVQGVSPPDEIDRRSLFEAALVRIRATPEDPAGEATRRVEALAGQLRASLRAADVAAGGAAPGSDDAGARPARARPLQGGRGWLGDQWDEIRSNLTLSSPVFRHALRMTGTLAAATALSHAFPFQHRYWLPMTALLVLRPDFTSTITRGLSRVTGTLIGAGLVTLALAELRPRPEWLIVVVVLLVFPAATLVLANYAAFSVFIASLVVTLLAFTGNPELGTAADRSIYTATGAALALAAYLLWPTWEATTLRDTLSSLALAQGAYARALLEAWSDPAAADTSCLQAVRRSARLARANAEAAAARFASEPDRGLRIGPPRETVGAFMAASRSCAAALLALHAELPAGDPSASTPVGPGPAAGALGRHVAEACGVVAAAVRGSTSSEPLPPLREEQLALAGAPAPPVVLAETDQLINAVNTLVHVVGVTEGT